MTPENQRDEDLLKVAQLWCLPQHENKEMDVEFAESIVSLISEQRRSWELEKKDLSVQVDILTKFWLDVVRILGITQTTVIENGHGPIEALEHLVKEKAGLEERLASIQKRFDERYYTPNEHERYLIKKPLLEELTRLKSRNEELEAKEYQLRDNIERAYADAKRINPDYDWEGLTQTAQIAVWGLESLILRLKDKVAELESKPEINVSFDPSATKLMVDDMAKEIAGLKAEKSALENEKAGLEERVRGLESAFRSANYAHKNFEDECARLKSRNEELEAENAENEKFLKGYDETVKEIRAFLGDDWENGTHWFDAFKKKISRLTASLAAAHEALEYAREVISYVGTMNSAKHYEIRVRGDDEPVLPQRKEWVKYLVPLNQKAFEFVKQALSDKSGKQALERWNELQNTIKDYEEMHSDHKRLVRELDVALNGDKAAKQASLCDLVAWIPKRWKRMEAVVEATKRLRYNQRNPSVGSDLKQASKDLDIALEALDASGGGVK